MRSSIIATGSRSFIPPIDGVRMDDGSYRVVEQQNAPAWQRGDTVRVENGGVVAGGRAPTAGSSAF